MCPFYWFWAEFVRIACSFKSYILLPCSCQKRDFLICSPFSSNYSAINFVWPINSTKWKETHKKLLWFYLNVLESALSISSIPVVIHCTAIILSAKNTTFRGLIFPKSLHTLPRSVSEWPFDQAYLLTHSRYARKLYDPKTKRIFEIARALFEKILFIHFYPHK